MSRKMKKTLKILGLIILLVYFIFVCVDCNRLRNAKSGTKPIITISEQEEEYRTVYTGLGYSVEYYTNIGSIEEKDGITYIETLGHGAEFKLFGVISIWGWEE